MIKEMMTELDGYSEYKDGRWAFCSLYERNNCPAKYPCHFYKIDLLSKDEELIFLMINKIIPVACDYDSEDVRKAMVDENDFLFPDLGEW